MIHTLSVANQGGDEMELDSILGVPARIKIEGNTATVSVHATTIVVTSDDPATLRSKIESSVWEFLSKDSGKL